MNLIQKFNPFVTMELAANALPLQGTFQIRKTAKPFWRKNKYNNRQIIGFFVHSVSN